MNGPHIYSLVQDACDAWREFGKNGNAANYNAAEQKRILLLRAICDMKLQHLVAVSEQIEGSYVK